MYYTVLNELLRINLSSCVIGKLGQRQCLADRRLRRKKTSHLISSTITSSSLPSSSYFFFFVFSSFIHFIDSGRIKQQGVYNQESYQSTFNWKQVGDNIIEFERKGDWSVSGRIEFDRDYESAKINFTRRDGKKVQSKIERVETN